MSAPKPDDLPLPAIPAQRFACAAMDMPWHWQARAATRNHHISRSPQKHYPTMSIEAMRAIPMRDILLPDAHVFFWITGPLLIKGVHLDLFDAWGLRPSSLAFVWIKTKASFDMKLLERTPLLENDLAMNLGLTPRQNAEFVVLGRRGNASRLSASVRQVIVSPQREHSRKPEEFYRRVQHYCDGPRIDMFGGANRPGWTHWGYQHRESDAA